jgi:uncharacterized membrane protein
VVRVSTLGDRSSDRLNAFVGSWKFVIAQTAFLAVWFILNEVLPVGWRWDPYPFILANLFMSAEAAYATSIVLMSQNRASAADRSTINKDLEADQEALEILKEIKEKLNGPH